MDSENKEKKTEFRNANTLWTIIVGIFIFVLKMVFGIFKAIFEGFFSTNKGTEDSNQMVSQKKPKKKKKGKMTAYEILLERGYSEQQAAKAIRNCQRDLEMAMDDGAMEELEDIVVEDLGIDSSYVDELI